MIKTGGHGKSCSADEERRKVALQLSIVLCSIYHIKIVDMNFMKSLEVGIRILYEVFKKNSRTLRIL